MALSGPARGGAVHVEVRGKRGGEPEAERVCGQLRDSDTDPHRSGPAIGKMSHLCDAKR